MLDILENKLSKTYINVGGIFVSYTNNKTDNSSNHNNSKSKPEFDLSRCDKYSKQYNLHYYDKIYSFNRSAGLRLLEIKSGEIGINYGCSSGNSLVYAANNCDTMVCVEQNYTNLELIQRRLENENLKNLKISKPY